MCNITKFHEFQVNIVVENVETLDDGWCMCMCVCGGGVPSLRCGFVFRSVREVWSCISMTHMKQNSWEITDTFP
jgi:hypothetical protein